MRRLALMCAALGAWALPAHAQEAMFLLPESAAVEQGSPLRLSVAAGSDANAAPLAWPGERIDHFFARSATTQENRDALEPEEGLDTVASWPAEHRGVLVVGVDLAPAMVSVGAPEFRAFVERAVGEAARGALALPEEGEVRILRTESAKALVRVEGPGPEPVSVATSKTSLGADIRPLMDPTAITPGSDLAVRLYAGIPGAKGGVVVATNTTTGAVERSIADKEAIANIHIAEAGRWRLEFHAVVPNEAEDAEAPWLVHSATLTFDVAEEGAE